MSRDERVPAAPDDLLVIDLGGGRSALITAARGIGSVTLRIGERTTAPHAPGYGSIGPAVPFTGAEDERQSYRIIGDVIAVPANAVETLASALMLVHGRLANRENGRRIPAQQDAQQHGSR